MNSQSTLNRAAPAIDLITPVCQLRLQRSVKTMSCQNIWLHFRSRIIQQVKHHAPADMQIISSRELIGNGQIVHKPLGIDSIR
ncbi:hypothetical protein D3C80_1620540 [compost metagenome]